MKKYNLVFICVFLAFICQMNAQDISTAEGRYEFVQSGQWDATPYINMTFPGCGGPGIVSKECIAFMWVNNKLNKPMYEGDALYWGKWETPPAAELRKGACCTLEWFKGYPCDDDAGNCNFPIPQKKVISKGVVTNSCIGCLDSLARDIKVEQGKISFTVCDSIYTIKTQCLVVDTTSQTVCEGASALWQGKQWETEGMYKTISFGDSLGCDTVHVLALFVNPILRNDATTILMKGDSVQFGDRFIHIPNIYRDTFVSIYGCDSISTLEVRRKEKEPAVCYICHQKWKRLDGIYAIGGIGLFPGMNFGSAQEIGSRPSWFFGAGYEWRLPTYKGLFKKKPCIGEAIRAQILFRKQHEVFVPNDCNCDNVPDVSPVTVDIAGAYRVDLIRQWPFVVSGEIEARASYNNTFSPDPVIQDKLKRLSGNIFLNPSVSRTWKLKGGDAVEVRGQLQVPVLRNQQREFGWNVGGILRF